MHIVDYTPPPTGEKFMRSDAKVRFIKGPVGSGKSTVCVMDVVKRSVEMPVCNDGFRRSRWAIVRNTNQQLKTTTFNTWKQWFPPGVAGVWKESEKTFYLELGDVRAEILFLPLDTPDDAQRLLSLELTGVFLNEAREIAPEIVIAAFSRTGRYPSRGMLPPGTDYWYGLIMDSNPPSRDSWLFETFEENKPEGWAVFHQPGGMEPDAENRENLPATYYEDMMNGATEDWIDVHVHGKYGRSLVGRPVYEKSFKRAFHVAEEPLKPINSQQYPVIIGMDFGRTPAAVLIQRDWKARVNVLDCLYVENIGLEGFLQHHLKPLLASKFPHNRFIVVGDPAGWAKSQLSEKNAKDILVENGLDAVRAPTNDVKPRIEAVEHLLAQHIDGKAALLFSSEATSPGMKALIAAMDGGYMYKRKTDGSYEATPQKNKHSHPSDAMQYAALGANLSVGSVLQTARKVEVVSSAGWT